MKLAGTTFLLLFVLVLNAQNFDDYHHVINKGKIPTEFITLSTEKYKKDIAASSDTSVSAALKKNERNNFYLESNFLINELFQSGEIIYNDTVGEYVSEIADTLLKNEPELRHQLRFYVIMTDIPNAFTMNNGAIFVSTGLIAMFENEAQLAFVLSHEITHFRKKHVIKQYIEDVSVDKEKGVSGKMSLDEKLLTKSNYSKSQESEADIEGFKLYNSSGYPSSEAVRALELIGFSGIPFIAGKQFEATMISSGAFTFSDFNLYDSAFAKLSEKDISEKDDHDKYSTHPATEDRIQAIKDLIREMNTDSVRRFSISARFGFIRKISRYELCRLLLLKSEYFKAIYAAAMLKQENPTSSYLDDIIAKALYGYCMRTYGPGRTLMDDEELGMETYPVKVLLESVNKNDLLLLSVSWNYSCYNRKKIASWENRTLDLMSILSGWKDIHFSRPGNDTVSVFISRDTIKANSVFNTQLIRLSQDKQFCELFRSVDSYKDSKEKRDNWVDYKNGESALGIDTLLVLDPFYLRLSPVRKRGNPISFIASEKSMQRNNKYIANCGKQMGMQVDILSPSLMKETDNDTFNEMVQLKSYYDEIDTYGNQDMVSVDADDVDAICQKHHANCFAIIGEVSVHSSRKSVGLIIASIIVWPTLPLGIIYALSPTYDSYNYVAVYDLHSGKKYEKVHYMRQRDSRATVNSSLYYNLMQIHSKPRK